MARARRPSPCEVVAVQRYVPDTLRRLWAQGATSGPSTASKPSAVLFIDVTGFTPLVSRLTGQGRAEIEELRHALDAYFGRAVDLVSDHGGDVFAFAGDALLALWWDDGEVGESVRRAASCGLLLRDQLSGWNPAPGVVLNLRLVVTGGDTRVLIVGGHQNRWESLAVGPAVQAIGPALAAAQPGDVVVDEAAWQTIRTYAEAQVISPQVRRLKTMLPCASTAREQYGVVAQAKLLLEARLLPAVRLWEGNEQFLGERRRLSILFALLPAIDEANPAWLEQLHQTVLTCQRIVVSWEGTLTEVTADDKGLVLVAAWGLPPLAHEDDATRAAEAALAISRECGGKKLVVSLGVATGSAYCGIVGNRTRAAYTMLGAPVNLAARLMQAARGRVLVDSETFGVVRGDLEFEPPTAIRLKGHAEPVAVHLPIGRKSGHEASTRVALVGRDAEIARVEALIDALTERQIGGVLLLDGEAGVGKSALAAHMAAAAQAKGVRVLAGEARSVLRTTPYHGVAGVLAAAIDLALPDDRVGVVEGLSSLFSNEDDVQRAPLLGDILGVILRDTALTARLSPEAELDARHAFASVLLARLAARSRVMVWMDDAHWLDSASWTLLAVWARSLPQVLFVVVGRLSSGAGLAALQHAAGSSTLVLDPLPDDALFELAARQLGTTRIPEALRLVLARRAAGNPFFSEELVASLLATGQLRVSGKQCMVGADGIDAAALPTTVAGLVTARVDRLPAADQRALKVASVLGRAFTTEAICAIAGEQLAAETLEAQLASNELVRPSGTEGVWEFRQMLVREAIYDALLLDQRRELHAAVVKHLVGNRQGNALAPHYPALALHATAAEDWQSAVLYLDLAGEQALARWANAEAARFHQSALHISRTGRAAVDPVQRGRWEARVAEASFRLGDMDTTIAAGYRALEAWGMPLSERVAGQLISLIGAFAGRFRAVAPLSLPDHDQRLLLDLYGRLVDAQGFRQSAGGFLLNIFRELALAEALDMPGRAARAWLMFYFFFAATPLESRARVWVSRARALVERESDPSRRGSVTVRLGVASMYTADWVAANANILAGIALAEAQGEQRNQSEGMVTLCHGYSIRGHFRPLAGTASKIRAITRVTGDRQIEGVCAALMADAHARSGNLAEAERELGEFVESLDGLAVGPNRVLGQGVRAMVSLRLGDFGAAMTFAQNVLAMHEAMLVPTFWTHAGLLGMAEVVFAHAKAAPGDARARALANRARKQLGRNGGAFRFGRALACWGETQWALVRGNTAAAATHAHLTASVAREDGILYLEVQSLTDALAASAAQTGGGARGEADRERLRAAQARFATFKL